MNKIDELVDILKKRESDEERPKNIILWVLAIIGVVAAVAGIAYAVYRFVGSKARSNLWRRIRDVRR